MGIVIGMSVIKHHDGIKWLQFDLLADQPRISHAVFFRHGGYSTGNYASLNLGYSSGDDPATVTRNNQKAIELLQHDHAALSRCIRGKLYHGKTVCEVGHQTSRTPECDALVTAEPNIGLTVTHADCQCILLYDPVKHVAANIHSGWRGSVLNICTETVACLCAKHHSNPADILACVGPSLGPQSAQFIHYKTELPEAFHAFQTKPLYFDFWAITEHQLLTAGVLSSHIEFAHIDTLTGPDCFSYRREGARSGRHATIIALK